MRIQDVLRGKGGDVVTIAPDQTVTALLGSLAEHGVGALVVSADGSTVTGIVSERDVVRHLQRHGPSILDQPVSSIMTSDVRTCTPEDGIEDMMGLMTQRRIRHVPVVVDGQLTGIVSIGDVVKHRMDELQSERDHLTAYISS